MAISFPGSKSNGQKFTAGNKSWTWNGASWKGTTSNGGDATSLGGASATSFLRSDADDSTTGSLGIGVNAPVTPLHIKKTGTNVTLLTLENYYSDISGLGNQGNYIDFKMTDDNETATPQVRIGMHVYDSDGTDSGQPSEGNGNFLIYTMEGTDALGNGNLTEKLRVTEKGNVGIGTTSPGFKLDVEGTTRITSMSTSPGGGAGLEIRYNAAGNWGGLLSYDRGGAGYQELRLEGSIIKLIESGEATPTLTVNNSNVGIGITNPSAMLEFGGNTTDNRYDIKSPADNARGIGLGNYTTFSTRYSNWDTLIGTNIRSKIGTSSSGEETASSYTASGGAGLRVGFQDLEFKNYSPAELSGLATGSDVNSLGTTRFTIDASGNLDMTGNISLGRSDGFVYLSNVGTGNAGIYVRGIGANNTLRSHSTGDFRWEVTGSQKMVLDSSGNLNIGSSAGSMKLNVNGSIYLGDNASAATGTYSGRHNILGADSNIYIVADGNTSSPNTSDKVVIGLGNTANTNYDSLRGASLSSLETPAVVTAEFYTDHAKMLKQLQLLNSSSNPSSPKTGAIYYNTTDDVVRVYSGTEWVDVGEPPMNATGGTVATYTIGGQSYRSHTFTSSGTFTPTTTGTVDVMVVAGGGCGGRDNAGGGGAGGVRQNTNVVVTPSSYTIVVGAGGAANTNDNGGNGGTGFNGSNSSAISITSLGGGFGGSAGTNNPGGQNRKNGGSGGGGCGAESTRSGGSGTSGQGNNGGDGHPTNGGGGGGGGAGAVGTGYSGTNDGGHGGIGIQNAYRTGSNIYYGGGGGAGNNNSVYTVQPGGSGGGGDGGGGGIAGSANTGGGGGGHTHPATIISGAGGSGIVVIRYPI